MQKAIDAAPTNHEVADDAGLGDFLETIRAIVERHVSQLRLPISKLDSPQKQKFVKDISRYVEFELLADERLYGLPVEVAGTGMMILFDHDDEWLGTEIISDGDIVSGEIDDAYAYPAPTIGALQARDTTGAIPYGDQVASAMVVLRNVCFKSGKQFDGGFKTIDDFSECRVALPLAHNLVFSAQNK